MTKTLNSTSPKDPRAKLNITVRIRSNTIFNPVVLIEEIVRVQEEAIRMDKESNRVPSLGYFKPSQLKFRGFDYSDTWQREELHRALDALWDQSILEREFALLPKYRIPLDFIFTEVSDPIGGAVDFQSGEQTPGKLNIVGCSEKHPSSNSDPLNDVKPEIGS